MGQDSIQPEPTSVLSVEPANLTTANEGTLVRLLGADQFGSPDHAWVEAGVELRADATGAAVRFAGAFEPVSGGFSYRMVPALPLGAGWYTVAIAPPSSTYRFGGEAPEAPAGPTYGPDGKYESHFRVGSAPLLVSVAACASDDLTLLPKLIVWFSEAVAVPSPLPLRVLVDGAPSSCALNGPSPPSGPSLELTCTPAPPVGAAISVSFSPGIVAASGGALLDATGDSAPSVELPSAVALVPCRTWRTTYPPTK